MEMTPWIAAILAAAGIAWAVTRDPSPSGMTPNKRGGKRRGRKGNGKRRSGDWSTHRGSVSRGYWKLYFRVPTRKDALRISNWIKKEGLDWADSDCQVGKHWEIGAMNDIDNRRDGREVFAKAKAKFGSMVKSKDTGMVMWVSDAKGNRPLTLGVGDWKARLAMWQQVAWAAAQNPHLVQTGARWAVGSALGVPDAASPATDLSTPIKYVSLGLFLGLAIGWWLSCPPRRTSKEADAGA